MRRQIIFNLQYNQDLTVHLPSEFVKRRFFEQINRLRFRSVGDYKLRVELD